MIATQMSILQAIQTVDSLEARKRLKVGDRVKHVMTKGVDWQHPLLNHKATKGGIVAGMSTSRIEIKVKWFETGAEDFINPLSVCKNIIV